MEPEPIRQQPDEPATPLSTTADLHAYYSILLELVIRHDPRLEAVVVDGVRRLLLHPNPSHPLGQNVQQLLRDLRERLLSPPPPEVVDALSQQPVRPVM